MCDSLAGRARLLLSSLAVVVSLLALSSVAEAQTIVNGGNVINQTWTVANSPYEVRGDVTVPAGAFLVIQSGVTVRFATSDLTASGSDASEIEMRVAGRLTVSGTAGSPVLFESVGSAGQWDGVVLDVGSGATTIDHAVITEAEVALRVDATPTRLNGLELRGNAIDGLAVRGDASATLTNSIASSNPVGVRVATTGTVTIDHVTLYANSDAVYVSSGAAAITGSILSNSSDDAIDVDGGSASIGHSNVWGNSTSYEGSVSAAASVIAANPLYVTPGTNLRLTSNSPSRRSASDGSDQGALPYVSDATPGTYGTLWTNTTIAAGTTMVAGDLTVAPGVTLTLAPGARLVFATSDVMGAYADASEAELRVLGTLSVAGTSDSPVTLECAGSAGQWEGVALLPGSSASSLRGMVITEAEVALRVERTPALLDALTLSGNAIDGLAVRGDASATLTNSIASSNPVGVRVATTGTVTIDHVTLYANSDAVYVSSGAAAITGSILSNSSDDAIDVDGGSASIAHSNVWGNSTSYEGSVSAAASVIAANPLYVTPGTNLRLTSNSPSRRSASDGSDQGALPYVSDATPGTYGTLWTNTTIAAGTTMVAGDLTVAPGVTLTLAPGARLVFATSDVMGAYADVSEAELRVLGTLSVAGTSDSPVTLECAGSAGQWEGVALLPGSSASSLRGMVITEAEVALRVERTPALLDALTLSGNAIDGLSVRGDASATITSSVIASNPVGVRVATTGTTTVVGCTLYANSDHVYVSSGTATIRNAILTNGSDDAIDVDGGSASISYSNVWGNSTAYEGSVSAGAGMLATNPFYVAPGSDMRLTAGSQCIDAGTSTGAPPTDRDGTTRPLDGDGINGPAHDMGAYEYALLTVCGDSVVGAGEACDDGALNGMYGRCNASCTGPGPRCGDMAVNGPEQCDDGNASDTDACLGSCVSARCGDGVVRAGMEACDDGNAVTTDACVACAIAECGDGFVHAGVEQCDDSNTTSTDACVECRTAFCGDGVVRAGMEACDDGNSSNVDACTNACAAARCGDGFVGPGETCDDGNTVNDDACSNACRPAGCGDGIVQSGETCDDGNTVNDDACSNACQPPRCGDGIIHSGEQCDDGNTVNDDACSNACRPPRCGDAILHVGEECDDGNDVPGDACTTACRNARCGDGFTRTGVEACDDGNTSNEDGCVAECVVAECGDGYVRDGVEACDDGNTTDGDGCSAVCALASCGDGTVQAGEECDDGNASNLDACLETCFAATCGDGYVRAGVEACDDGNELDTDACLASCRRASCGDGFVHAGEEACDDANAENTDACLLTCEDASCGDGYVRDGVEECDDGNDASGDGCSAGCVDEGSGGPDGGVDPDAGTSDVDSGTNTIDAGIDAGTATGSSEGGCGCRAAGASGRGAGAWALMLALGLALVMRRRR
ncbi:DUF4215 domain-containing protein [Sandaracinus amylolyticus]|uniref:Multiple EGF-like-domain protein 3 n=1 Tax=Sandaracinus amylolyticus TaxID=927083 RepID=A0A0F6SGV3_9BACT|nr:DUF4215 domain-containing protein [Sandaracinus amylolyticus]AKF09344.1 Multiple EGF-like-domain protein 3 precursor [Sandaracinus amylolyticus]